MGSKQNDTGAALREQAAASAAKAEQQYEGITTPDIELEKLQLQSPELVGLLQAQQLGPSAMEQISTDPRLRAAQISALQGLQERGAAGFTPEDQAMLTKARQDAESQAQAQDAAATRELAERGLASSGSELATRLQAGQSAANRQGQQALDIAAQSAAAKRQALAQAGQMGAQMEQQQFGEQAAQAQAKDAIAQMNMKMRADVAAQNLAQQQRISEAGTATANAQQQYNKQLQQQQFANTMALQGAKANAYLGQAGALGQVAAASPVTSNQSMFGSIATAAIPAAAGGFAQGYGAQVAKSADGGIIQSAPLEQFENGGLPGNMDGGITKETYADGIQSVGNPNLKKSIYSYKDGGVTKVENHYYPGQETTKNMHVYQGEPASQGELEHVRKITKEAVHAENGYAKGGAMSLRPPKKWFERMEKQISKSEPNYSEQQVGGTIGKIWSNMSEDEKAAKRKAEGKRYGQAKENGGPIHDEGCSCPECGNVENWKVGFSEGGMPDYMDAYARGGVIPSPKIPLVPRNNIPKTPVEPLDYHSRNILARLTKFAEGGIQEKDLGKFTEGSNAVNKYSDAGMPVKLLDLFSGMNATEKAYFDRSNKMDEDKAMAHLPRNYAGGGIATKFLAEDGSYNDGLHQGGVVGYDDGGVTNDLPMDYGRTSTNFANSLTLPNQQTNSSMFDNLTDEDMAALTGGNATKQPASTPLSPLQRGLIMAGITGLAGGIGGAINRKKVYYPGRYQQVMEEGGIVGKDVGKFTKGPNADDKFRDAGMPSNLDESYNKMSSENKKYFQNSLDKDETKAFRFPSYADGGVTPRKPMQNGALNSRLQQEIDERKKLTDLWEKDPENQTIQTLIKKKDDLIKKISPSAQREMSLAESDPIVRAQQEAKYSQLKDLLPTSKDEGKVASELAETPEIAGKFIPAAEEKVAGETEKEALRRMALADLAKMGLKGVSAAGLTGAGLAALGSNPVMAAQMAAEPTEMGTGEADKAPQDRSFNFGPSVAGQAAPRLQDNLMAGKTGAYANGGYPMNAGFSGGGNSGKGFEDTEYFGPHYNHTSNYQEGGMSVIKNYDFGGVQDGNSFTGDKIPARINSGEMVNNIAQQQKIKDALNGEKDAEYVGNRVDKKVKEGKAKLNEDAQQQLFDYVSGKAKNPPKKDIVETKKKRK